MRCSEIAKAPTQHNEKMEKNPDKDFSGSNDAKKFFFSKKSNKGVNPPKLDAAKIGTSSMTKSKNIPWKKSVHAKVMYPPTNK